MIIDKNPRQITRLRVEDQKKLEELATELTYNSTTNAFEIGTNLGVNGYLEAYNDSSLTFYQGNNAQTPSMGVSPLFDANKLSFFYNDGQDIDLSIMLDVSVEANILTDENTKTIFGKSIMKDPEQPENNIDLYVHYLQIIADSKFYNGVVISSNNTAATGTGQGLTALFKAPADTSQQYITVSDIDHNVVGLLIWNGSIWSIQLANDNFVNVTSVTDRVEPI